MRVLLVVAAAAAACLALTQALTLPEPALQCLLQSGFYCKSGANNGFGNCIDQSSRCDGFRDCTGKEDEQGCNVCRPPHYNDFKDAKYKYYYAYEDTALGEAIVKVYDEDRYFFGMITEEEAPPRNEVRYSLGLDYYYWSEYSAALDCLSVNEDTGDVFLTKPLKSTGLTYFEFNLIATDKTTGKTVANYDISMHILPPLCKPGYELWNWNTCIRMIKERANFKDAQARCHSDNATLAQPRADDKNAHLYSMVKRVGRVPDVWIGASDQKTEGTFVWTASEESVAWSAWIPRQPDDWRTGEDCVVMRGPGAGWYKARGRWNDRPCSDKFPSICEYAAPQLPIKGY